METFSAANVNVWFKHNGYWFWLMSVKRFRNKGINFGSCIHQTTPDLLQSKYTCPSLLWLIPSLSDKIMKRYTISGLLNLFEMYLASIHVDLVASLSILVHNDTNWIKTDAYPLILRSALVSETLFCSKFIRLMNFSFPWKVYLTFYLKTLTGVLQ